MVDPALCEKRILLYCNVYVEKIKVSVLLHNPKSLLTLFNRGQNNGICIFFVVSLFIVEGLSNISHLHGGSQYEARMKVDTFCSFFLTSIIRLNY